MASKEYKVGNQILHEDDLKFTVVYNGEVFTMHYPSPLELTAIEAEIVRRLGGFPRSSYPTDHLNMVEAMAYVNELLIRDESPAWFKSAWTSYDTECTMELFRGYLAFRGEFQDRMRRDIAEAGGEGGKS